ncbi:MAG: phosphatase PAP2 family protein [Rhizobiaceae bacterium]|nr:phosphatase PAP2 family protein [Rhizobiaceae bacterium]
MPPISRRLIDPRPLARWTSRHVEGWTALRLLLVAAAIWGFAVLADEMMEGETHAFDTWLLLALRDATDPANPYGPGWLREMVRDVTGLGGIGILTLVTLAAAGFLWIEGKHRSLFLMVTAVFSGFLMSTLLKTGFDRPRPDLVPHGSITYTASFPSGHAMLSAVVYLTLAVLLARVQTRRRVKLYILSVATLLTIVIGMSRVYLGVHWPTDVMAGWAAGSAWALMWWMIANWLEKRGVVEGEETGPDLK